MAKIDHKAFRVENYKSIKDSEKIRTPGISLLLGPNSSGKTNLLESILLLKQSLNSPGLTLLLNGPQLQLGEFKDVIHLHETTEELRFSFYFERNDRETDSNIECPICHNDYQYDGWYENHLEDKHGKIWPKYQDVIRELESRLTGELSVELTYEYEEDSRSTILRELSIKNPSPSNGLFISEITFENLKTKYNVYIYDIYGERLCKFDRRKSRIDDQPESLEAVLQLATRLILRVIRRDEWRRQILWDFGTGELGDNQNYAVIHQYSDTIAQITNEETISDDLDMDEELVQGVFSRLHAITRDLEHIIDFIKNYLDEISHVGPLRNNPQRIYFGSGRQPGQVGSGGQNLEEMFFRDAQIQDKSLINATNEWLNKSGFNCELEIREIEGGDLYQVIITEDGLTVNLADTGFGLSQTLPIIAECINKSLSSEEAPSSPQHLWRVGYQSRTIDVPELLIIQQPEIHLNPKIEADLGDFFIEIADSDINVLIETHSEHLLNRIQRRVADGTIDDHDMIRIYFVSKSDSVSEFDEIKIDQQGLFSSWPDGFFQDDFDEAIEILKETTSEQ